MAHPLASLWEERQTSFLTESNNSITVHYKPERTGEVAVFDSFFQEGTNPADPTSMGVGSAANILLFDYGEYLILPTVSTLTVLFWEFEFYNNHNGVNGDIIFYFSNSDASIFWRLGQSNPMGVESFQFTSKKSGESSEYYVFEIPDLQFFKLKLMFDGTALTIYVNGTLVATATPPILSQVEYCFLRGVKLDPYPLSGANSNGNKFKNFNGSYMFGLAYTDIAQQTLAAVGEDVASVINVGSLGGNMEQSTASARPELYTGSVNSIGLTETTPDSITVSGKVHLDLHGASINAGEGEQQLQIGQVPEADALFTCLLSEVKTSTDPDPLETIFDNVDDTVKYIVVAKDGKRYDIEAVKPRGMGSTPFVVDVFLNLTNKEI